MKERGNRQKKYHLPGSKSQIYRSIIRLAWLIFVENQWYNPNHDELDAFRIIASEAVAPELAKHLVEKELVDQLRFPNEPANILVKENIDFLCRFWKSSSFVKGTGVTTI